MKRREFITLLGGAAAAASPLTVRAQQPKRVGVLISLAESDPEGQARVGAFRQGLEKLGWVHGRNIQIDYRWSATDAARLRAYAAELVGLKPDVIFAASTAPLGALHRETKTIPIVFAQVSDPVGGGFVASLARPGGNITGFTQFEYSFAVKWLEMLKQIAPPVRRVSVIYDAATPASPRYFQEVEAAAAAFGVEILSGAVRDAAGIESAVDALVREANGGLIVLPGPITTDRRDEIVALAARHRLPAVYAFRYFVAAGGLASYGVDNIDLSRNAAIYVDRILKGEKPGDLPVQQATKFELVINLKTAKALGLDIPISLLARTDEVIE